MMGVKNNDCIYNRNNLRNHLRASNGVQMNLPTLNPIRIAEIKQTVYGVSGMEIEMLCELALVSFEQSKDAMLKDARIKDLEHTCKKRWDDITKIEHRVHDLTEALREAGRALAYYADNESFRWSVSSEGYKDRMINDYEWSGSWGIAGRRARETLKNLRQALETVIYSTATNREEDTK